MINNGQYEAVVMGVSAGGLKALEAVLPMLPAEYPLPIIIVQHRIKEKGGFFCRFLGEISALNVIEAEDKTTITPGSIFIAPPEYHLQVESDRTLSLSLEGPVNWSRPSIDVLFETAAEVYRDRLVGVVLTGANDDGSRGLAIIKQFGGLAVIQDPDEAVSTRMPTAAIEATDGGDYVLSLEGIGKLLAEICGLEAVIPTGFAAAKIVQTEEGGSHG